MLGDNFHDAIRRAAQREGIFRARRLQTKREHSCNAIGLIRDGKDSSLDRTRHAIVHRLRLVLIVDGIADGFGGGSGKYRIELLGFGVQTADDALQFGKLFHQLGGEVGLGKQRRFEDDARPDRRASTAKRLGNQAAQLLHPHRLVEVAAQNFLEGHRLQHVHALAQRNPLVGFPEEARIVETGAQHALVAVANQSIGITVRVQNRQKMRQQFAAGVLQSEILLVVAHHRDQNLIGEREKLRIEVGQHYGWKLG